jgi:hypothetical protein
VQANINLNEGAIVTHVPIVSRGNPWAAGKAVGPDGVYLVYYTSGTMPEETIYTMRIPNTGYEGSAYTDYGIEIEKRELVDLKAMTAANAQAKFNLMKDVVITGTLPIEGLPIPELLNLQKRIYFSHPTKDTGANSLGAIVTGYTYTFGKRGVNSVQVTTDMSGLVKVR